MQNDQPAGPYQHTLPSGRVVALGRPRASVFEDPRTHRFKLANFVDRHLLPPLQDRVVNSDKFQPQMFGNDRIGDCVFAGEANFGLLQAALDGQPWTATAQDVIARYAKLTGYDPASGANDNGAVELDALNDWRHDPFNGLELLAFVTIDVHDLDLVRYGIQLCGAVYDGIALPTTAQAQEGGLWDVTPDTRPGSWGGHCTLTCDFDWTLPVKEFKQATWGGYQRMSQAFWHACVDEVYCLVPSTWKDHPPNGVLIDKLLAELRAVGQETR